MHIFQGTLLVEEIHGRKGLFCVGTLKTSIGDFKVKDPELDQFKAGAYNGTFTVERIFTKGVPWRGGFFTEIIAKIAPDGFLIDDEGAEPTPLVPSTQAEPDPVDEHSKELPQTPATDQPRETQAPSRKTPLPSKALTASAANAADDEALFGVELFALLSQCAPEIELDPTVDREQFRRQRDRLKSEGYRFDSKSQRWLLPLVTA